MTRPSAAAKQEFVRKVRTIAGTFQLFAREAWLFDPRRNPVWFETFSHKGLRLTMPALQALALRGEHDAGRGSDLRRLARLSDVVLRRRARRAAAVERGDLSFAVTVPYTICLLSWATIVGFVQFVTGRQKATWDRVVVAPSRLSSEPTRVAAVDIAPPEPDVSPPVIAGVVAAVPAAAALVVRARRRADRHVRQRRADVVERRFDLHRRPRPRTRVEHGTVLRVLHRPT